MKARNLIIIIAIAFAALTSTIYGAEPIAIGNINGKIYDKDTKEALPGVNVMLIGGGLGTTTNEKGTFTINVPEGIYDIKISSIGYAAIVKPAVKIQSGHRISIDVALESKDVQVDGISVMADPYNKSPEMLVSTNHFSNSEMRTFAGGFQDPVRAFSILPGVAQTSIDRNDLLVRGGAPSENLMIVDGFELPYFNHYSTQGASGGFLSFINMEFVDQATFSTGGFGARYGDKLSSICDIRLADGSTSSVSGKATLSATQFGLNLEGPLSDQTSFIFSARKSYLDLVYRAYNYSFVPEFYDYMGKMTVRLGNQDKLSFLGFAANDDYSLFNDSKEHIYENAMMVFSIQSHKMGGLQWLHMLSDGYFSVSYEFTQSNFNDSQQYLFSSHSQEVQSTLKADFLTRVSPSSEISAGAEGSYYQFHGDIATSNLGSTYSGENIHQVNAAFDTTGIPAAAYVQATQMLGSMRLTLGARATYFDIVGNHWYFAPRFSARIPASNLLIFTASIGQYYQAPSSIWLVSTLLNRQLTPIGARHIVIGSEYCPGDGSRFSLEVYHKQYSGYPVSIQRTYLMMENTGTGISAGGDGAASYGIDSLVSAGSSEARGIEFMAQKKSFDSPWNGMLSATYAFSEFTPYDGIARPSDHDQRFILNVSIGYIPSTSWSFNVMWHYVSGQPYTPYNVNLTAGQYNSERIPANHSMDLNVSRYWKIGHMNIKGFINIQNLYNRRPNEAPVYSEKLQRVVEPEAMGIVPSIGITLEVL